MEIGKVYGQDKEGQDLIVMGAAVDQSKRVPLLEAAIYELKARIETLEQKQ